MRLNTSSCTLFVLSSLFLPSSALPFLPRSQAIEPKPLLIPRASYSVVPVDGGAPTATAGAPLAATTTVSETVTQTAPTLPPVTVTVVSTALPTAGIKTVTSLLTVTQHDVVQTSLITIIPSPATITIMASAQETVISVSTIASETGSPSSLLPAGETSASSSTMLLSSSSPTISPTSTSTVDNGQWHTTYPAWSNSSSATVVAVKPRQTTILF